MDRANHSMVAHNVPLLRTHWVGNPTPFWVHPARGNDPILNKQIDFQQAGCDENPKGTKAGNMAVRIGRRSRVFLTFG